MKGKNIIKILFNKVHNSKIKYENQCADLHTHSIKKPNKHVFPLPLSIFSFKTFENDSALIQIEYS